jgi:hypothetical protein
VDQHGALWDKKVRSVVIGIILSDSSILSDGQTL